MIGGDERSPGVGGQMTIVKSWTVSSPTGRRLGDHVCWPFRRDADAVEVAQAYVAEGLAGQERVAYVGEGYGTISMAFPLSMTSSTGASSSSCR